MMTRRSCTFILFFLIGLLMQPGARGNDPYYDPQATSRLHGYSPDSSGIQQSTELNFTETRHHRFGQQTGIGSSYLQTQSATTEDQPGFTYRPTAVSPVVPTDISPALRGSSAAKYSQVLSSPALSFPEVASPALSGGGLENYLIISPELEKILPPAHKSFSLSGHKQPAGGALGRQLLDPMKGL